MNKRPFFLASLLLILFVPATLTAAELYWVDTDAYGTIVGISREDGTRVWSGEYYPFGEQFRNSNQRINNQRTFLGKEYEPNTGLTAVGARNYSAELGRFTSADPIGPVNPWTSETNYEYLANPHRLNRYTYGLNNPYRYVDPDGMVSVGQVETGNPGSYGGENTQESMYERSGLFERDYDSITYGTEFVDVEMTLSAIDPPGSFGVKSLNSALKGEGVLSRVGKTLRKQADELVSLNNGKSRVTLRSPSHKMEVDLAGKAHGGVPTPHTKVSPRNPSAPKQPAYNTKNSPVIEATQQDLRTVRHYLERQYR